jgi:hypothetical membrane protein
VAQVIGGPPAAVPWWARVTSVLAPVLLIGGWTVAASLQAGGFDSWAGTISALAALDATDRWVMTLAIAGTGVCHVVTSLGLRPAARTGRILLAGGGVATVLVAVFPLPSMAGQSLAHGISAFVAFLLLAVWPFAAWRRVDAATGSTLGEIPWGLRRTVSLLAGSVLVALLVGFGVAQSRSSDVGLTERLAAGAQALWPAVVVATAPRTRRRTPL